VSDDEKQGAQWIGKFLAIMHGSDDHELKVLSAAMLVAFLVSEMDDEQRRAAMLSAVIKRLPSKVAEFLAGKAAIQ